MAYAIAFKSGKLKNLLLVLVVAPFFTSFLLRTIAWKQILGEQGFVVPTLRSLHLISESTTLTSSAFAVVAGMTYNFLPFMTLPLYASIDRIDPRTLEASGDLYANGFTTFRLITLPNMASALLAGALLAFGLSFDEIVVTTFTAGPGIQTLPIWIYNNLFRPNQAPIVNVVAAALIIVSIVPIYLSQRLTQERK